MGAQIGTIRSSDFLKWALGIVKYYTGGEKGIKQSHVSFCTWEKIDSRLSCDCLIKLTQNIRKSVKIDLTIAGVLYVKEPNTI